MLHGVVVLASTADPLNDAGTVVVLVSAGRYERGPRRDATIDELLISFLFRRRLFF